MLFKTEVLKLAFEVCNFKNTLAKECFLYTRYSPLNCSIVSMPILAIFKIKLCRIALAWRALGAN